MATPTAARNRKTPRQSVTVASWPADDRANDGGESSQHCQAAIVAKQLAARVDVPASGLGDDDAYGPGEALDEPRGDECLDGWAERAQG